MRGRNSTCVDNRMTGARVCVRPCESDTIHGHERVCRRTRAGTRKVRENEREIGGEKEGDARGEGLTRVTITTLSSQSARR